MTQTVDQSGSAFNIQDHLENPYPLYAALRQQETIVFNPDINAWFVSRFEDAHSILTRPEIFSSRNLISPMGLSPAALGILMQGYPWTSVAIDSDGVNHQRFRGAHTKGFSAARTKEREEGIRALANRLVDSFIDDGHADLISQFAYPFSLENILNALGIPQSHMTQVKQWGRDLTDLLFAVLPEERQIECAQGVVAFQHYAADLIEQRRAHPEDGELDALIGYQLPGAEPLSLAELISSVMGFMTVGHRTTLDECGSGFSLLLKDRALWESICAQPDLIPSAVEEILRYESASPTVTRETTQEVEIGGVTLPAGAKVVVLLGSANRDEKQFSDAHVFDIHRAPNRHVAFGHGAHFCVGAPLARLELRIALETFARRIPTLCLVPNQPLTHTPLLIFRGLEKLEVEW
jgi:cytochrome P450